MQTSKRRAVGILPNYASMEIALTELSQCGFQMDQISIVGRDIHHTVTAIGSLAKLLTGMGSVHVPSIGQVLLAGMAATAIVNSIAGSFISPPSGSLAVGLTNLGIPIHRAKRYSDQVSRGHYMVVIDGIEGELALAHLIFTDHGVRDWYPYEIPHDVARRVLTFSTMPLSRTS
jgi:hypothetical protein